MSGQRGAKYQRYDDLPWLAIRDQYETTTASFRQVADMFGIRSHNSIRKRALQEGWAKDLDKVATYLAANAVARGAVDVGAPAAPKPAAKPSPSDHEQESDQAPGSTEECDDDAEALDHEAAERPRKGRRLTNQEFAARRLRQVRAEAGHESASRERIMEAMRRREEVEREQLEAAVTLGRQRLQAVRREIDVSARMEVVAEGMLEHLGTILLSQDLDEVAASRNRLRVLNPDVDSLEKIAKVTTTMLQAAMAIRRRALGMPAELKAEAPGQPVAQPQNPRSGEIMKRLPIEVLHSLRRAAAEVSRLPAQTPQRNVTESLA